MKSILITGAAGNIAGYLRKLLKGAYPRIRWSDVKAPADLSRDEEFIAADLANRRQVERIVAGMDGIVHLGACSHEGEWDTILSANIVGCHNLFDAAYRAGVQRIVFASS